MSARREFLVSMATGLAAAGLVGCAAAEQGARAHASPVPAPALTSTGSRTIIGGLSGAEIPIPDVDAPPMPSIAPSGVIHDGRSAGMLGIDPARAYPDVRSARLKLGVLVPATNTSVEHELWSIILANRGAEALAGVGLHTVNVATPRPQLRTKADLLEYQRQFLHGLGAAVDQARLARPHYLVMGMSLEHILHGIEPIRAVMREVEARSGTAWATWHDAAPAALARFGARRIGLLTPFDRLGNENAARMFEDLGFEVVSSVGFACTDALHIAHIPDAAKERAIRELLATRANRLDAIVQCGTNMSLIDVTERLEPGLGIPILGINAVTLWYALRENGLMAPLVGGGRLLREH
jgi:maleate isomerase